MKISAEELNILATLIANALAKDLNKSDLNNLRFFISQVSNCLGYLANVKNFSAFDKKFGKGQNKT